MKTRIVAREKYPSFRQLCAIVRHILTTYPNECEADLKERIKLRHVSLGYLYSNDQIPRAMDAVERAVGRYVLTAEAPRPPINEMEHQIDPPWRAFDRRSSEWTNLKDLVRRLSNRSGTGLSRP